jgi:L-fuconolactonase
MVDSFELIDAQVHVWEADHPGRPWATDPRKAIAGLISGTPAWRDMEPVSDTGLLAAMDAEGVDGAVLVTSATHYGFDNSYALECAARSSRLRVVGRVDPERPGAPEFVAGWMHHPRAVGLRVLVVAEDERQALRDGRYDGVFAAAQRHGVPICTYPIGQAAAVARLARRFSELSLVVDHLGLAQPPMRRVQEDRFAGLADVLALAEYPNVTVKLSGTPTLSRQAPPFADVWPPVHRLLEAFGCERVMWGTDWTRTRPICGLRDQVRFLTDTAELSTSDKRQLLSATARRVFRWQERGEGPAERLPDTLC